MPLGHLDDLREFAAAVEQVKETEEMELPDGYLLPEGKTMADVRRLDLELLASEGLDIKDIRPENDRKDGRPEDA